MNGCLETTQLWTLSMWGEACFAKEPGQDRKLARKFATKIVLLWAFHKILHYKEVFSESPDSLFWQFFSKDSCRCCASPSTKLGLCFREQKKKKKQILDCPYKCEAEKMPWRNSLTQTLKIRDNKEGGLYFL